MGLQIIHSLCFGIIRFKAATSSNCRIVDLKVPNINRAFTFWGRFSYIHTEVDLRSRSRFTLRKCSHSFTSISDSRFDRSQFGFERSPSGAIHILSLLQLGSISDRSRNTLRKAPFTLVKIDRSQIDLINSLL